MCIKLGQASPVCADKTVSVVRFLAPFAHCTGNESVQVPCYTPCIVTCCGVVGLGVVVCQLTFQEKIQEKRSQPTVASWQYLLVRDRTLCILWLETHA